MAIICITSPVLHGQINLDRSAISIFVTYHTGSMFYSDITAICRDDFDLDADFDKLPSFNMDMSDLDISSPIKKKTTKLSIEKSLKDFSHGKDKETESFSFSFDFDE